MGKINNSNKKSNMILGYVLSDRILKMLNLISFGGFYPQKLAKELNYAGPYIYTILDKFYALDFIRYDMRGNDIKLLIIKLTRRGLKLLTLLNQANLMLGNKQEKIENVGVQK